MDTKEFNVLIEMEDVALEDYGIVLDEATLTADELDEESY